MSSDPEGLVPASSVPYVGTGYCEVYGLRFGQTAEGQANRKIGSVPKTRAGKGATEVQLPAGRAKAVRTGTDLMGKSVLQWSWVMMVTDEERTFQNLDCTFLPPVPHYSPELLACVLPTRTPGRNGSAPAHLDLFLVALAFCAKISCYIA